MPYIIYFGAWLSALFGLGYILRPSRSSNVALIVFYWSITGWSLHAAIYYSGDIFLYPHILYTNIPFILCTGPAIYLHMSRFFNSSNSFPKKGKIILHFMPAFICMGLLFPVYTQTVAYKIELIKQSLLFHQIISIRILIGFALIWNLIYIIILLVRLRFLWVKQGSHRNFNNRLIVFIFTLFLFASVIVTYGFVFSSIILIQIAYCFVTAILVAVFIIREHWPNFMLDLVEEWELRKYNKSKIEKLNVEKILDQLDTLMLKDKIYCDETLSLNNLAMQLAIVPHQLSQILNERLQKNYNSYINEFRIKEAEHLLKNDLEKNILHIAYACGFNSSSTFHDTFRKITGKSPGAYRKSKIN